VYSDKPNAFLAAIAEEAKITAARYSLGFVLNHEGTFIDVVPGSPAYRAGLGPGMKVVGVNGRK
jgi:predicted metalloprotease with PDZ domain